MVAHGYRNHRDRRGNLHGLAHREKTACWEVQPCSKNLNFLKVRLAPFLLFSHVASLLKIVVSTWLIPLVNWRARAPTTRRRITRSPTTSTSSWGGHGRNTSPGGRVLSRDSILSWTIKRSVHLARTKDSIGLRNFSIKTSSTYASLTQNWHFLTPTTSNPIFLYIAMARGFV